MGEERKLKSYLYIERERKKMGKELIGKWGNGLELWNKVKLYLAMVSLQFGYSGMHIITMVSLKRGMSHWVLVVYRHAAATLVIAPFALVLERSLYLILKSRN